MIGFCRATVYNISIRAPARGATATSCAFRSFRCYFNPRSREGSDRDPECPLTSNTVFQSALPRGERRFIQHLPFFVSVFQSALPRGERHYITSARLALYNNFNPRSREGSDALLSGQSTWTRAFQSALPRGERLKLTSSLNQYPVFQSALPRGERPFAATDLFI